MLNPEKIHRRQLMAENGQKIKKTGEGQGPTGCLEKLESRSMYFLF